ncbi:hypothetical protein ACHAWF_009037 [Thalassiosira exigua]
MLQDRFGVAATGAPLTLEEQAQYKYHIDLESGGGVKGTSTLEKLALPGLLFHIVGPSSSSSASNDWVRPLLEPWVNCVPVKDDLSDLREKYEWAESHPEEARKIAEAGTDLARRLGTPEGFEAAYRDLVARRLGAVVAAFDARVGKNALDVIFASKGGEGYGVVARCGGTEEEGSRCRRTGEDVKLALDSDVGLEEY